MFYSALGSKKAQAKEKVKSFFLHLKCLCSPSPEDSTFFTEFLASRHLTASQIAEIIREIERSANHINKENQVSKFKSSFTVSSAFGKPLVTQKTNTFTKANFGDIKSKFLQQKNPSKIFGTQLNQNIIVREPVVTVDISDFDLCL